MLIFVCFHRVYASIFHFIYCRSVFFAAAAAAMAFNQATSPPVPKPNERIDYYPLWKHVTKIARIPSGGS